MPIPRPLAEVMLRLGRWNIVGEVPTAPKYIVIAQHTSNWDFVWMLVFTAHFRMDIHWIGKDAIFRWPFGRLMRALGGIAVDRTASQDLVSQLAAEFQRRDRLVLAVAPEGTRYYVDYWKSGFYAIARQAGVPILPSRLDYGRRLGGFGDLIPMTGDVRADMDRLREFYRDQQNLHPELTGRVRLKSEDARETG